MAQKRRAVLTDHDLQGLKYFRLLTPLLARLQDDATARDRAGNRQLHFDQYASLLLLFFFNPICKGLRSLQQASQLAKVQKLLGCPRTSLGSLSEARRVFDPDLLHEIIGELAQQAVPIVPGKEAAALQDLAAIDGSLLPALPKMAWALWQDDQHRAAKMHVCFSVVKAVPLDVRVTHGNASEREQLRAMLQPGAFLVFDRGYVDYQLYQDIVDAQAAFVGRLPEKAAYHVQETRALTPEAQAAGVLQDLVIDKLGSDHHKNVIRQPLRILVVATGKSKADGTPEVLLLCTSRLDLPAELVALAYRFRWAVELFFRWFKCILGCRHLLSTSPNGVTIQVYLAMMASLLISLWVGRKPTQRTLEMLQFYFTGWATAEELQAHLDKLKPAVL